MIFGVEKVLDEFLRSNPQSSSGLSIWPVLTIIPLILILSSKPATVFASQDLTLYRMQHYDMDKVPHGSRYSTINLEMKAIKSLSQSYSKKCLLIHIHDLLKTPDTYKSIIKESTIGGLLIIVPENFSSLSPPMKEKLILLEESMLENTVDIPVYFVVENTNLQAIHTDLTALSESQSKNAASAFDQLVDSIVANGYQLFTQGAPTKPIPNPILTNIETRLLDNEMDDQMPTITLTAHYDSFGIAPGLSFGGDSNASGMVALLELCRLFSKLYSQQKVRPAINLVFLLTGGGKFNYLGSKKWIEEQLDHSESNLLADSLLTISLDSLGHSVNDEGLFVHVSKPPKENTTGSQLYENLTHMSSLKATKVTMTHKKINLAEEVLSWEHERYRLRRLPALSISSLKSPNFENRNTMSDYASDVKVDKLCRNIELIAESLARIVLNSPQDFKTSFFKDDLSVSQSLVTSLLTKFSSQSRAQQLLLTTLSGPSNFKVSPLLENLSALLKKYSKRTRFHHFRLDSKEPEVVFYDQFTVQANIYNIKPAIFDFFLSIAIVLYLGCLYLFLTHFSTLHFLIKQVKTFGRSKENGNVKNKQN